MSSKGYNHCYTSSCLVLQTPSHLQYIHLLQTTLLASGGGTIIGIERAIARKDCSSKI
ncbi:uncharacterized protein BYT42DRAFT_559155 [Radiomyces spectabilis]|uniref:uncharacterized protein n=1 Tax=Radiomyces spectabilis TaxID=64574 RepID=UPI002220195B|nr:uncharacterized protein BYT42DRAFT_559155 [Radiomyces spectabilis]KAI8388171.1 hypothetical protein BYT42DRAFT_559155 [Radiomyces spectabilis]